MAARGIFGLNQAAKTAAFCGRAGKKKCSVCHGKHGVSERLCGPCGHIPSKIKSKPSAACEVTPKLEDACALGPKKKITRANIAKIKHNSGVEFWECEHLSGVFDLSV